MASIHDKRTFDEVRAVSLVCQFITRTYRAMPDLKALDRWPNYDGFIEMVAEDGQPGQRLLVQVKKIPPPMAKAPSFVTL